MAKKSLHERIKEKELGKSGKPEVDVPGGRLDGVVGGTAIQVAIDPTKTEIREDVQVLKTAPQKRKTMVVNKAKYVPTVARVMREEGVSGTARTPKQPGKSPVKVVRVPKPKR